MTSNPRIFWDAGSIAGYTSSVDIMTPKPEISAGLSGLKPRELRIERPHIVEYRVRAKLANEEDIQKANSAGLIDARIGDFIYDITPEVLMHLRSTDIHVNILGGVTEFTVMPVSVETINNEDKPSEMQSASQLGTESTSIVTEYDPGEGPFSDTEEGPISPASLGQSDLSSGTVNMYIPDNTGSGQYYRLQNATAPTGSWVTNLEYRTRIEDNADGDFYCGDYEIWLFSGNVAWETRVYDNLGGATDGGYDDDAENDADIYLNWRSTHFFDDESPNQYWGIICYDNWGGDDGWMNYIEFRVHWETPPEHDFVQLDCYPASPSDVWTPLTTVTEGQVIKYCFKYSYTGPGATATTRIQLDSVTPVDVSGTFYADTWVTYSANWTATAGNHRVRGWCDVYNNVTELNEGNNNRDENPCFNVVSGHDFVALDCYPASPSDVWTPLTTVTEGQAIKYCFKYSYAGPGVIATTRIQLDADPALEGSKTHSNGETVIVYNTTDWIATVGNHRVRGWCDVYNNVTELNEGNNNRDENPCFNVLAPALGEIHGAKWNDLDGYGNWDGGEPGLSDWKIYIDENGNGQWDTGEPYDWTGADGSYSFVDLAAGTYVIGEVSQAGWVQTYPRGGALAAIQAGPTTYGDSLTTEELAQIERMDMNSPPTPPMGVESTVVTSIQLLAVMLSNVPKSTWTYGCSATSAGMMFGYYDRTGYPNIYTGPTNGGVAPLTDLGQGIGTPIPGSCSIIATQNGFDGRTVRGHVDDYWTAYLDPGPDPWEGHWAEHAWGDCTADYMGTNQWKWDFEPWPNGNGSRDNNVDGSTSLWANNSAAKLYDFIPPASCGLPQTELCHGLRLFAESRGYTVLENYTQKIDTLYPGGFSFADYMAEIDAGHPVMIQVTGHSMVGVGYDGATQTVYLHDTWDNSVHSMTWGGSYSGMSHIAVTVIHLAPSQEGTHTVVLHSGEVVSNINFGNQVVCTPPQPPSSISYPTNSSTGQYTVSWSSSTGATSYQLERSSNGGSTWSPVYSGESTSYPENVGNGSYRYRVNATNTCGSSGWTTGTWDCVVSIPPPPGAASNPVPANAATNVSLTQDLSWTAGSGATSHDVYFGTSSPGTFRGNQTGTTYDTGTMSNNTTYYWRIDEKNASGTTTGTVWSFTTVPVMLSYITISGPTLVNENSGAQYTCTAYYSDGSSPNVTNSAIWSQNSSYATINTTGYLTTLSVTSDQPCKITATYGGKSDDHDITIKDVSENADLALTNLTVSPSTVTTRTFTACSFNIVNNSPTALSSEGIMVDYYLSSNTTFGDGDDVKIGDTGSTVSIASGATYPINLSSTGLANMVRAWPAGQPCGNYYIFARVTISSPPPNDPDSGNNYDRTDSTIFYNPSLSAPTSVSATDGVYTDKVNVSWNSSVGATSYEIWRNTSSRSNKASKIAEVTSLSYDDTSAVAGTTYWYWVKAKNSCGTSSFSSSDSGYRAVVQPPQPPAPPTGVSASDGTYTDRVRVFWNASTGATSYEIWRNTRNKSSTASKIAEVPSSPYDDMSAVAGTTYWYWVKAKNSVGTSVFSNSDSGNR
jgi:hypothetical protein